MKSRAYLYEGSGVILAVRQPEHAATGSFREASGAANLPPRNIVASGSYRGMAHRLIKTFARWFDGWLDRRRERVQQTRLANAAELAYLDEDRAGGWLERRDVLSRAIALAKSRATTISRSKHTDWDEKLD